MRKVSISIVVTGLLAIACGAVSAQMVQPDTKTEFPSPTLINRCGQPTLDDPHGFRCDLGR